MAETRFFVKKYNKDEFAVTPKRGTPYSAGYDLSSSIDCVVPSKDQLVIPLNLIMVIPKGHYGKIAPRSGIAKKFKINVHAGVIDSDYRGSVDIILFNHGEVDFKIKRGDRVAQLILEKISTPEVEFIGDDEDVPETERGEGGFGSTGYCSTGCCSNGFSFSSGGFSFSDSNSTGSDQTDLKNE